MQILILGMHRSGTSMLTRLVNLMGAYFGPSSIATKANEENPKGFWERKDVRKLNDDLLFSVGADWHRIVDYEPSAVPADARARFEEGARAVIAEMDAHSPWVMKEPRLCINLPAWLSVLEHPVCLICVRDPLEIARSLQARNHFPIPVCLALTQTYYRRLLRASDGLMRAIVTHRELITDPLGTVRHIHAQLGLWGIEELHLPSEAEVTAFVDAGLYRQRNTESLGHHYLTQTQADFFAALHASDWAAFADMLDLPKPELDVLRMFEADIAKAEQIEGLAKETRHRETRIEKLLDEHSSKDARIREALDEGKRKDARIKDLTAEGRRKSARIEDLAANTRRLDRNLKADRDRYRKQTRRCASLIVMAQRKLMELEESRSWRLGHSLTTTVARSLGRRATGSAFAPLRQRLERALSTIQSEVNVSITTAAQSPSEASLQTPPTQPADTENAAAAAPPSTTATVQSAPPSNRRLPRHRITVVVIAWDTGHNPLGRAYLIAEALARRFNVLLIGPGFERYGSSVWPPVRDASIATIRLPGGQLPEFTRTLKRLASKIEADVIVACKARMPSLQLGLMMKAFRNRPLLVDVDGYELSFFQNRTPLDLAGLSALADDPDTRLPYSEAWTRYAESLLPLADGVLVSNVALQEKYGGLLIPHARDEILFDRGLYDRATARARFGYGAQDKVVLFLGTPRWHKGVLDVARALRACNDPRYKLCIIGSFDDRVLEHALLQDSDELVKLVPDQPFADLPQNLMVADVVCLFQDPTSEVAKYQLPAKAVDALAMGAPVISTALGPLRPLIEAGGVITADEQTLVSVLRQTLDESERLMGEQSQRRDIFLREYSYAAISSRLEEQIIGLLDRGARPLDPSALAFLELQRSLADTDARPRATRGDGIDIVLFWKQNDSGLYGRRSDMFAKYLARHPRIRQVLVLDRPMSLSHLMTRQGGEGITHTRQIFIETWRKRWGLCDGEGVSRNLFLYSNDRTVSHRRIWPWPAEEDYPQFLRKCFADHGIDPTQAVFLVYPKNEAIRKLIDTFRPRLVVADVVDDHRAWPGLTQKKVDTLTAHYRDVVSCADLVIANCEQVQQSMSSFGKPVTLVANACETEPPPRLRDSPEVRSFQRLQGPKVGYVGNMEAKIDLDLLHFLANARPQWQFVLIGSTHANPAVLALRRHRNVHFFGVIPYPQVRGWIAQLDVAIIPHLDTPQTRSMNPLKAYVYASVGVPVVSTRVDNLNDIEDWVAVTESKDDFLTEVERAIERHRSGMLPDPWSTLAEHSWEARVEQFMGLIEPLLDKYDQPSRHPLSQSAVQTR
jgi:glycosyltransferase involved in cell wall biosynthesis